MASSSEQGMDSMPSLGIRSKAIVKQPMLMNPTQGGTMKTIFFATFFFIAAFAIADETKFVQVKDSEIIEVDLGPISEGLKPPPKLTKANPPPPLYFIMHTGYKSFAAPDDVELECWEVLENFYFSGDLIYIGWIVANFEDVKKSVLTEVEVQGEKNFKFRGRKSVPGRTVRAFFIRKSLASVPSVYQIVVTLIDAGSVYDIQLSRFIVNQVF